MSFFSSLVKGLSSAVTGNPLGVISMGMDFFSGQQAQASQNAYNQQYLQYLRDTNEQNYKMFQEQMDYNSRAADEAFRRQQLLAEQQNRFQTSQWHRENTYNDPSAQLERWTKAGFSPYSMLNSSANAGSIGASVSGASQGSAPQAQTASPIPMDPGQPLTSPVLAGLEAMKSFSQSVSGIYDSFVNTPTKIGNEGRKIAAEIGSIDWDSRLKSQLFGHRGRMNPLEFDIAELGYKFDKETYEARKESIDNNNRLTLAQEAQTLLSAESQRIANKYLDTSEQLRLSLMAARIYEAIEAGNLSKKRGQEALAHAWLLGAQAQGQEYDNKTKKAMSAYADKYASETILGLELANDKGFHEGDLKMLESRWFRLYGKTNETTGIAGMTDWTLGDHGDYGYPKDWRGNRAYRW